MDQIREQITHVLDQQGVLSRLKAELRANVFSAINDQDVRQGGPGLGGKSDAAQRSQLAADPAGMLLLELLRELLQWCNLKFTQQVFEQEMPLGPAAPLEALQQQLGPLVTPGVDQPLLLQLLKQHLSGRSFQAAAAQADTAEQLASDAAEQQPQAAAVARSSGSDSLQQSPGANAEGAGANAATEEAEVVSAGRLQSRSVLGLPAALAAGKGPGKSLSLLGQSASSVAEESGLIGTQLDEDDQEEYATVLLPAHRSSSDAGLEEEASSGSSTYPVDTPRITSRPHRTPQAAPAAAAAAEAAAAAQPPLSSLRPSGGHQPLPPLPLGSLTRPQEQPAAVVAGNSWDIGGPGGMAAACELSESFGHDRSFGDSSLELQGLDSPPRAAQTYGAAAAAVDAEASYSSRSSGSSRSSRAISPSEGAGHGLTADEPLPAAAGVGSVVQAAGGLKPLPPAVRPPGKLAPLPAVSMGAGSSSSGVGLSTRTSEGLRDELLRSGLLMQQQQEPAAPAGAAAERSAGSQADPTAEASSDSLGGSDGHAPAPQTARAAAGAAARVSDTSSEAASDAGENSKQDLGGFEAAAAGAAGSSPAVPAPQDSDAGCAGSNGSHSQAQGSASDDDSDDFGVVGQQQLLAAARRQLSNTSSASQGAGQAMQQQPGLQAGGGVMEVEVSGASLTLTASEDLDVDLILEESLPSDALMDGSGYSGVFEPAQPAGAGSQPQAWATSTRPVASAAARGPSGAAGGLSRIPAAQQALELTDDESDDEPLAAAEGFAIDDDDF